MVVGRDILYTGQIMHRSLKVMCKTIISPDGVMLLQMEQRQNQGIVFCLRRRYAVSVWEAFKPTFNGERICACILDKLYH